MPPVCRFGPAAVALIYAAFAALWIVLSGSVLEVSVSDPVLQSRIEIGKGIVFVIVSSLLLYGLMRARRDDPTTLAADEDSPAGAPTRLLLTCVLVVLAVPVVGLAVFALNARQAERETFDSLTAVATSTAQHIEGWLAERRGDATSLSASRGFIDQVVALRADPDTPEREAVIERLDTLRVVFDYAAVTLLDPAGVPVVGSGQPFVGMAITEAGTQRMLRYNDRLCEMFGYGVEGFAQQTWNTLGHPEDAELGTDDMARMERGEIDAFTCEKRFLRLDGSSFIGRMDVKCVRKSDGALDHVVTTIEDVTEAFRTEQALRESEQRFRLLLQGVPSVAVQGYSMDGTTRYWNRASETLYGYSAEEAIGRSLLDLIIPPEMRDEVRAAMHRMAETGENIPAAELTLMRKDGSRVTVFSAHARVVAPGREPELFCIDVDLTARKQAEEALRASEAEFRTLAEATPQIV